MYRVTGTRPFRGHTHGDTFEARLDHAAERRAVARGDIEVVNRIIPSIRSADLVLPSGWQNQEQEGQ